VAEKLVQNVNGVRVLTQAGKSRIDDILAQFGKGRAYILAGYLQHGKAGEPMRTECVRVKVRPYSGLNILAPDGAERTDYMAKVHKHWRRVFLSGYTHWVLVDGARLAIVINVEQ
jgi:hypothetical protein